MTAARAAHAGLAMVAIIGIALNYSVVPVPIATLGDVAARTIRFLSFFTVLTNALVAVAAIGFALPSGRLNRWAVQPGTRTAITVYILVVALIFHLLLRHMVHPGMAGWLGNLLVHQLVPALWTLCWLAFGAHGGIEGRAPLRWIGYPLVYAAWTLAHGAAGGWYPYPFMNVAAHGYPAVARNMLIVGLVFLALGYALRWVDGWLGRRAATF